MATIANEKISFEVKFVQNVVSGTFRLNGIRIHNVSDDKHRLHIGSYKSIYHMIMTTKAPLGE